MRKTIFFEKCLWNGAASAALVVSGVLAGAPGLHADSIHNLVERELVRRQGSVGEANELIAEGHEFMVQKDYLAAQEKYRAALNKLPETQKASSKHRKVARNGFATASVNLAEQRIEEGRFEDAEASVEEALLVYPSYRPARTLDRRLSNPDYFNRENNPAHYANIQKVEQLFRRAKWNIDLGLYDEARGQLNEILNIDRFNRTARRLMTVVEKLETESYEEAYTHTRAKLIREVNQLWESAVPLQTISPTGVAARGELEASGAQRIREKLKRIVIPRIEFSDTTVEEAILFLQAKSRELDTFEADPARRGVNFVIRNRGAAAGGLDEGGLGTSKISLSLSNVPLVEALKYVTDLAGLRYKVDNVAVVVLPLSEAGNDLYNRVWRVPPNLLTLDAGAGGGDTGIPTNDPFAEAGGGTGAGNVVLTRRPSAKDFLERRGVTFPPGATAFFNAATSELVARNTESNLEIIEALVENIPVQNQVFITTKFVEVTQLNLKELGFDWLLGQSNVPGSGRVFSGGGTTGFTREGLDPADYTFFNPGGTTPVGTNPVTSGNRSGTLAVTQRAIDDLLQDREGVTDLSPGVLSLAGVFTDPQFQVIIRALNEKKGVDLLSAPSVTTRSGQRAKIEVIREFTYPTEYEPPEIPTNFGNGGNIGGGGGFPGLGGGGGVQAFPVTPATPTAFETKNTGISLEVEPVVGNDGLTIDLNLAPEVVEFEGFINYGSPISTAGTDAFGNPISVVLTENRIEMPVFSVRRVQTAVTVWDGHTVAIGGLIREDVQKVEDKVPILGGIPFLGRLFRTDADAHFKRNLVMFVTARLIDPAGENVRKRGDIASSTDLSELEGEIPITPGGPAIEGSPLVNPPPVDDIPLPGDPSPF